MYLHALGHFHPENLITNAFLAELVDTSEGWIQERVGISTRHTVLPLDYLRATHNRELRAADEAALYSNVDTSERAARMALQRAGLEPSQVGMVVAGGCTPQATTPAEACQIAERLGIDGPSIDLNSACSSFGAQLYFLEGMRPERLPDFVLVVNPENTTRVIDYTDRSSCVLWGDATTATVLSPRVPGPWRVSETLLHGDPSGADKVRVPRHGHFTQNGRAVQAFAIRRATELYLALASRLAERGARQRPSLIGHQANLKMLEAVRRRCEVPDERHHYNVDVRGNCGAAGAPSVLSERWGDPTLGDALALVVVGAGLTWAGSLLERT